MTSTLWKIRTGVRDALEAGYEQCKAWIAKHAFVRVAYTIFSWLSLSVFVIGLFLFEDARTLLVQYLWSFYVFVQFWALCRSKTLPWRTSLVFVPAGAVCVAALTVLTVYLVHSVAGGDTSDTWSMAILTPIVEEAWKLLPLGIYLLFSRRASALSLSDFTLIGAASGIGFQFSEELARRLTNSGILGDMFGYSFTMLGGETIHWDLFSLFPGRFEESMMPSMMSVSHPVHTAMIALCVGFAVRLRNKVTYRPWSMMLPVLPLLWAILDHAAYNGQYELPGWVFVIHKWTGSGYQTQHVFLFLLVCALLFDYWALNKIRSRLPVLRMEPFINPLSELWTMVDAIFRNRGKIVQLLRFYRQRRELGFTYLYGNEEAAGRQEQVRQRLNLAFKALTAALLLFAGLWAAGTYIYSDGSGGACFACLFDSLQNWWDGLSWFEKGILVLGVVALSLFFVELWPAIGIAMTAAGIAGSGHEIAGYIRDPRKLLTPENLFAAAATALLSRIPFGGALRWVSRKGRDWLERLLRKLGHREPEVPVPRKPDVPETKKPDEPGDQPDHTKDDEQDAAPVAGKSFDGVELTDNTGNPVGELDSVDLENGIFYEDKTAKGLDIVNPRTGLPAQTPQQFADKQILVKTRNRIINLQSKAVATRPTAGGSPDVPPLEKIKSIRNFVFRLDGDTPELRAAVENSLKQLRTEFPDYTFKVRFGGKA